MIQRVTCPSCSAIVAVPESLLGQQVRCAGCAAVFIAKAEGGRAKLGPTPKAGVSTTRTGKLGGSTEGEAEPHDTQYEEVAEEALRQRELAFSRVKGPAVLLIVVGAVLILAALLAAGIAALAIHDLQATGVARSNFFEDASRQDLSWISILASIGAVVVMAAALLVMLGGFRLRRLRSYRLVVAAVIALFIVGVIIFQPLIFIGVWALVVLLDMNVKENFDRHEPTAG